MGAGSEVPQAIDAEAQALDAASGNAPAAALAMRCCSAYCQAEQQIPGPQANAASRAAVARNPAIVSAMMSATGFTSSMRPAT